MRTKEEILSGFKNRFGKVFADKTEYLFIELLCDIRDEQIAHHNRIELKMNYASRSGR